MGKTRKKSGSFRNTSHDENKDTRKAVRQLLKDEVYDDLPVGRNYRQRAKDEK